MGYHTRHINLFNLILTNIFQHSAKHQIQERQHFKTILDIRNSVTRNGSSSSFTHTIRCYNICSIWPKNCKQEGNMCTEMLNTICMQKIFSVFDEGIRAFPLFHENPNFGLQ